MPCSSSGDTYNGVSIIKAPWGKHLVAYEHSNATLCNVPCRTQAEKSVLKRQEPTIFKVSGLKKLAFKLKVNKS